MAKKFIPARALTIGMKVMVLWEDDKYYPGTILKLNRVKATIKWDDGSPNYSAPVEDLYVEAPKKRAALLTSSLSAEIILTVAKILGLDEHPTLHQLWDIYDNKGDLVAAHKIRVIRAANKAGYFGVNLVGTDVAGLLEVV